MENDMELLKRLENWGCDIEGAMDRFLGDEELYIECLHVACEEPSFEKLGENLAAGNVKEAFEAAHCLKGVLANLGLEPMLAITVQLVEPLRAGKSENLLPYYKELLAARETFRTMLKEAE